MHLLVVGGGSAGHVIPALPVIDRLHARGWQISFVGTRSGLEVELTRSSPAAFYAISAGKLRRYWSWQNLTDLFRIAAGIVQAWRLIGRLQPDVIFSKGGFVSFPVALAGWLRRVPVVAHESDLTPGLANRLVLPFAQTLCTSFAETKVKASTTVVHTGTPIRPELVSGDPAQGRARLGIDTDETLLLVTGGSLGADALNAAIRLALPELVKRFQVVHVCGEGKLIESTEPRYHQLDFVAEGWGDLLAAADIVISRAGANALFELLTLGKLNLLVPLSAAASRGDQLANAAYAQAQGFSRVLQEQNLDTESLLRCIDELLSDRQRLQEQLATFATADAAAAIVGVIENTAQVEH